MPRKISDFSNLISQAEAARIRGISKQAIGGLIRRGRLSVVEIAGKPLLSRTDVEQLVALPVGRPRKKAAGADSLKLGKAKRK